MNRPGSDGRRTFLADDHEVALGARLRVLVGVVEGVEERDVIGGVEVVDPVLPALVQVDSTGVRDREDPGVVDGADRATVGPVDQPVLDRRAGSEPDLRGGRLPTRPVHLPGARHE